MVIEGGCVGCDQIDTPFVIGLSVDSTGNGRNPMWVCSSTWGLPQVLQTKFGGYFQWVVYSIH